MPIASLVAESSPAATFIAIKDLEETILALLLQDGIPNKSTMLSGQKNNRRQNLHSAGDSKEWEYMLNPLKTRHNKKMGYIDKIRSCMEWGVRWRWGQEGGTSTVLLLLLY